MKISTKSVFSLLCGIVLIGAEEARAISVADLNTRITNSTNTTLDYLIQDVCVSGGVIVAGDPYSCATRRNIRIGEKFPYIHTDFGPSGARYQSVASLPIRGSDGLLKVMVSKDIAASGFSSSYSFNFVQWEDGFDLLEVNGTAFSAIRTNDPECGDQMIYKNVYQREDGWLLFPAGTGTNSSTTHTIRRELLDPPYACYEANGYSYVSDDTAGNTQTAWNSVPFWATYQGGKQMQTIQSYHIAHYDMSRTDNGIELFMFTREYGFTRWEAWYPYVRCVSEGHWFCNQPELNLAGRCDGYSWSQWGGQWWVRMDCRDSTNYMAITTPMHPLTYPMALYDVDFPASIP